MSNNQQWFWLKNKERLTPPKPKAQAKSKGLIKRDRTFDTYLELTRKKD